MATNQTSLFTDSSSSDATQSFFNRLLLERGVYAHVHSIPVAKKPLGMRQGKTMIFRRYTALGLATTALNEGVTPSGKQKAKTDVAVTINQYGDYIEDNDMVLMSQPDPQSVENTALLGQQFGETMDQIDRDVYAGATNIIYANGTSTVTVSQIVDKNDLDRAYRLIRNNKAVVFNPMIQASQNVGTGPVGRSYWGLLHEDVAFDVRHTSDFLRTTEYGGNAGVLEGEIGSDKNGIRFLSSPNGFVLAGATGVTIASTGLKNTSSFLDVYSIFVCGQGAIGGVSLGTDNGGIIRKALGSAGTSDPIDQRATIGWKKNYNNLILNQSFFLEIQCGASL